MHGRVDQLSRIHAALDGRVRGGDRVVYCGNLIGRGPDVRGTLNEALLFRRAVLARPGVMPEDIVFLRGAQEEMLHRLLQIQFARGTAAAEEALAWMAREGARETLLAWGCDIDDGIRRIRLGPTELARWTNMIRQSIRATPGHDKLLSTLQRAAFTAPEDLAGTAPGALFVASGINPDRPLEAQGDSFWWDNTGFTALAESDRDAWNSFRRVIRGLDRAGQGFVETPLTVSLDGGDELLAGLFNASGELQELVRG